MDRFSDRGSTPLISTKSKRHPSWVPFAFALIWRESNGSVVNACRWHAEPTLTEPAGENSTPRGGDATRKVGEGDHLRSASCPSTLVRRTRCGFRLPDKRFPLKIIEPATPRGGDATRKVGEGDHLRRASCSSTLVRRTRRGLRLPRLFSPLP